MFNIVIKPKCDTNNVTALQDWVWPKSDVIIWRDCGREWVEQHSIKWLAHVRNFNVCVQAGGACGMYPRMLAERFKTVYTFEPQPVSFYCLVANCQVPNIIKMQAALGNVRSPVSNLYDVEAAENAENVGLNADRTTGDRVILRLRIDDLSLPACDLIALDVEGNEDKILLGAEETIERFRPVVVAERGTSVNLVRDLLLSWGYSYAEDSAYDAIYVPN